MKLVDMKLDKKPEMEEQEYPYGLSLSIGMEQLQKLGFKELPRMGDYMTIQAKACVTSVMESANYSNIGLQIEELGLSKSKEKKDLTKVFYEQEMEMEDAESED